MNTSCEYEREIVRAAGRNVLTDEQRAHAASCEDCREAVAAAAWMGGFARISDREHILPDPAVVYLKAQLLRSVTDASRIAQPLNTVQMLAYLVVAAGWAAVLTWKWAAIEVLVHRLTPAGMVQSAANAEQLSMSFFAIVLMLATGTLMLAVHTILREE
jgi:hypothetical protein